MKAQCGNCAWWKPYREWSGHCQNRQWLGLTGKPIPSAFEYPMPRKTFKNDGLGCRAFKHETEASA